MPVSSSPARPSARRAAGAGPMPMMAGSTPVTAQATIRPSGRSSRSAAVAASVLLLAEVLVALMLKAGGRLSDEAAISDAFGSPAGIGELFLTDHLLAFEITSIVLLVAAVGGVVLGMRTPGEDEAES